MRAPALERLAAEQQVQLIGVPAPRGTITDTNGVFLAVSEPADDIAADPALITNPAAAAARLSPMIGVPQSLLLPRLADRASQFVYLARALPQAAADAVMHSGVPGLTATPVNRRVYPRGALAAQVLGLVGTAGSGLAGLEFGENSILGGSSGERRIVDDGRGQPISISNLRAAKSGESIQLTLDANIQARAEDVLEAIGRVYSPLDATAIVMNPDTGALLAVANWPRIDDNTLQGYSADNQEDRAIGFDFEPGSTFKIVTVAGALTQGLVTPETQFNLPPSIQVGGRVIHDAEPRGWETLSTSGILAQSSNVGAITIALRLGANDFNDWVHRFGFGSPTGVDLPGEEPGVVIPPSQYSGSSMGNLPIGQGELVTPLQIANAYAAIANGGILRAPHIIQRVNGKPVPEPKGRRIISTTVAAEVRSMLQGVLAPGGTASEVSIPGYELAGKTGTANKVDPATGQYSQTAYVASFVGFAPAKDPKLLCAVVVDQPQGDIYGGTVAAPAFGQIMGFALPYLGIAPNS
ncbi:MAG TPA: penicillin-binding protein 2 [Solirubrobacteraceae bacterium]|nr:penicillin-binding protein 2 [Solirubrobacteraceae bacterium]